MAQGEHRPKMRLLAFGFRANAVSFRRRHLFSGLPNGPGTSNTWLFDASSGTKFLLVLVPRGLARITAPWVAWCKWLALALRLISARDAA